MIEGKMIGVSIIVFEIPKLWEEICVCLLN
jgi:hypothetical protein